MDLSNLSVLITGGAGFIGSHIAEYLLRKGIKFVRILDNLSTGSMVNINHLLDKYTNIEFVYGDIRDLNMCMKACNGITEICHQAALGSVPRSINNPLESHNVNVNGFLNILLAAKNCGIMRVVYASSSSVYGTNNSDVKLEEECGDLLSPYAVTKKVNELYAHIFSKIYGLECIGLRYFNVFGPRQNPNGPYAAVIPKFIRLIMEDIPPTINGDGSYSRDFTYVENVVHANHLALTTKNYKAFGNVFNIGTNNNITIYALFNSIKEILKKKHIEPIYGPVRVGDVPYSRASIEKAKEYLGYEPLITFTEGLEKTVQFFIENRYKENNT
jgi:UDP-N-acetylglucosamine 4-epimerase